MNRLLQPLLKNNGSYKTISFEEAFQHIYDALKSAKENSTMVMTSGDYFNEELYLLQRLARTAFRTNALGSFDYYKRGTVFFIDKNDIVPFSELLRSTLHVCFFDENADTESIRMAKRMIGVCEHSKKYYANTPETLNISNYGDFFRSINRYLVQNDMAKGIYVEGLGKNYGSYKQALMLDDYARLLESNGLQETDIQKFANMIIEAEAPVFVIWERMLDERGIIELENMCMLLDIQAKPSTGFLSIKSDFNSQGLFDMGLFPTQSIGGRVMDSESVQLMESIFEHPVVSAPIKVDEQLQQKAFVNCLLFNATGVVLPEEVVAQVRSASFSMLQTAFWDEQTADFDLIMPASLPEEANGTYTDSTRTAHVNSPEKECPLQMNTLQQLSAMGERFGLKKMTNHNDIFLEYLSFIQTGCRSKYRHFFR